MPRLISQLLSLLVVASVVMLVAGCGRKQPPATQPPAAPPPPVVAEKPPPPPPAPPPTPPTVPPAPATPTEEELFARMSLDEINAKRPLETVFFHYDRADLTERARNTLQKNAGWLSKFKTWNITVEGHADSRGTSEYNLALGERRAAAVRDYLVSLGVPTARINIVSKGKEQPTCTEETETCWAANRRGNFIVTAK